MNNTHAVTHIRLIPGAVVIYRGAVSTKRYHEHPTRTMTDASRLRLNDYLAEGVRNGVLRVVPYVGPGWNGAIISFIEPEPDAPAIRKNVNAGKIAEQLHRIQGGDNGDQGLSRAVSFYPNDAEELKDAIAEARSDLIQLMLVLRDIEEGK